MPGIEIGDSVIVVSNGGTYSCYEEWVRRYVPAEFQSSFKYGAVPNNSDNDLYTVVAKANHGGIIGGNPMLYFIHSYLGHGYVVERYVIAPM